LLMACTPTKRLETDLVYRIQGFYDPVNEKFFEPTLTGISYSFTQDGYYEEALYRAAPNREDPPFFRHKSTRVQEASYS